MSNIEVEHLESFLEYLLRNSHVAHIFGPTRSALTIIKKRLQGVHDKWIIPIKQMIIPIKNKRLESHDPHIVIGGIIEGNKNIIIRQSISLYIIYKDKISNKGNNKNQPKNNSCCNLNGYRNRIVRKFHFDYQITTEKNQGIIPLSHIQYGGELKLIEDLPNMHYCLDDYLENPRICYPPLDLLLVFDFILREFDTDIKKILLEGNWKKLVKKSESKWLKDYYKKIDEYFKLETKKQTLFDYLYSMEKLN